MLISGFCIYYIKAQNYGSFLLKTSHSHLKHAILMFPGILTSNVLHQNQKKQHLYGKFHEFCLWGEATTYLNQIFLLENIFFTPLLHSWGTKNSHFLLKSRFFQIAKRPKIAYFDVDLLNRKMVSAKTLLKSRFLLILTLLKPRFHCITIMLAFCVRYLWLVKCDLRFW